jgi:subtilisin family serine protease
MKNFIFILIIFFVGCGSTSKTDNSNDSNYVSDDSNITSNDTLFSEQWALYKNSTTYSDYGINDDAHIHYGDYLNSYGGKGIKVAIIDNGLDVNHEDLKNSIISTYSFVRSSSDVAHVNSTDFHGTAVTGIVGAKDNSFGVRGVAPRVEIIFIQFKASMTNSEMVEMFDKAENFGADIISCSWGTGDVSTTLKNKIVELSNNGRDGKGTIIIFSSGNENSDMGDDESSIDEVIGVGSTNSDNVRSKYSNYGEKLEIMAPGGYYYGIATTDVTGEDGNSDGGYLRINSDEFVGTSASAPIVSGVVALLLEINSNLTRVQIMEILRNSSDKIGEYEYENGRNDYYGYGKINVQKAMDLAKTY